MRDQDFDALLATLERPVAVDPAFSIRLFTALAAERRRERRRPVWLGLLAAALVGLVGGALVLGAGGRGNGPVALGQSPEPMSPPVATSSAKPSAPLATPSCPARPVPSGATRAGCIDVNQTYTWSLDRNVMTPGGSDLFFEAVTPTDFYLTRSFDWPGPMTDLRIAKAGGRAGCLAALRTPDPGATAWPMQTDPAHFPDYPHGIPFSALTPDTPVCAISLGDRLYEVHLEKLLPTGIDEGNPVYVARLTWIDWGLVDR
jgi:hypothetical protein